MNDQANTFGCYQTLCAASSDACVEAAIGATCYLQVCKFDKTVPSGQAYVESATSNPSCSATSCAAVAAAVTGAAGKTECGSTTSLCCKLFKAAN